MRKQLEKTGSLDVIGAENILPADDRILASLKEVYAEAQAWLEETATPKNSE